MKQFWILLSMVIIIWSCDTRENSVDSYFIEVNSQPIGARIFINGIDAGVVTPNTIRWSHWTTDDSLIVGLELEGYFSWNTAVVREKGQEYIWHQMSPDYPVGELGNAELPDTVWFTDTDFSTCSDPLIGTMRVQGKASNVIGDSVAVVILCQGNSEDTWRIVPQPNGKTWVPLYGYGFWQAEVDRAWWHGSVIAMLINPDGVVLDTNARYSWWNLGYDIPLTALNALGNTDGVSEVVGWKINWASNSFGEPHLRIQGEQMLIGLDESYGTYLYSFTTVNAPCPFPYKTGKYSLTVDCRLDELSDHAKFVFAVRPLGEWDEDHWVGFEFVGQDSFHGSFMNGLMGGDVQRSNFSLPSSWPGSITYQIELTSDAIGLAELRFGLGENPDVWQDSTSFIVPIMDQTNIVLRLGSDGFGAPLPTTTVTLGNFTYTP